MDLPKGITIKENSLVARLAARRLGSSNVAIVFGRVIHLYGVSVNTFLSNEKWVKHELKHVAQYQEYGYWRFLTKYLLEWVRKGYYMNRFEVEARAAESE